MANRPAPASLLRDGDREELERWTRASTAQAGAVRRARIVLLAGQGVANQQVAATVGVSVPTVLSWRSRHQEQGLAGLGDAPRAGCPRTIDHGAIVTATLTPPPRRLESRTGPRAYWPHG